MKKILMVMCLAAVTGQLSAQQWAGSTTNTGLIYRDGNVVIGATSLQGSWAPAERIFQVIGTNSSLALFSNTYAGNYILGFFPQYNYSGIISAQHPLVMSVGGAERMRISTTGNVTIGSIPSTPAGYRLFVDQGILAEKVKVALKTSADWADHVFQENYKLMPLEQVADFVRRNKHLPEIPSATEMVKEGNDLGKTDARLLEKIEELTLYLIAQQEKIALLEKRLQKAETALEQR